MVGKSQVYEWISRFKRGDMSIDDKIRSGRSSTLQIHYLVKEHSDRWQTIDQIAQVSGLSWSSVQRIFTDDLPMYRIAAKFAPRFLIVTKTNVKWNPAVILNNRVQNDAKFMSKTLLVMKLGAMGTTQKPNNNPDHRRRHCHSDQKTVELERKSKQCRFFLFFVCFFL